MNRDLHSKRKDYQKFTLEGSDIFLNPFQLFDKWYKQAEEDTNIVEENCMILSTSDNNIPRSRIVLLKEYSKEGFIFYTNYNSIKGRAIESNNQVCLNFFWHALEKQIIINGIIEKVSEEKSIQYFNSRPIDSRISAIASNQSSTIKNREVLNEKVKELKSLSEDKLIKPKHWGGYIVKPYYFEFWQGRKNRLHDRIAYNMENKEWHWYRLSP